MQHRITHTEAARGRIVSALAHGVPCVLALFLGTAAVAAPAPRPARRAPARDAPDARPPAEDPSEGPLPGSGTRRIGIPDPRPITAPGTGTDSTSTAPRRPSMAQLDASDPQRREARELAVSALKEEGGAARVATMAAADVGARSDEAARVLGERSDLSELRQLAKHPDPQVRVGLARAVAYSSKASRTLLVELLGDRSLKVVRAAVHTAGRVGAALVLGKIAAAALRYDRSVRASALAVLAQHASIPAARSTVIAAATHPIATIRLDAVLAIGISRAAWARQYVERLEKDLSKDVRSGVARSLGKLPPDKGALRILGRLAQDRAPEVRREANRSKAELERVKREARKERPRGKRR